MEIGICHVGITYSFFKRSLLSFQHHLIIVGPVIEGDFASLRERYPPRRVIIQQCSVLPRIKFSGADQSDATKQNFGGSRIQNRFPRRISRFHPKGITGKQ